MKNLSLIIGLTIVLYSCKTEQKVDYAVIKGKIENNVFGDLTINTWSQSLRENVPILSDNTFQDTLKLENGFYVLHDGKNITPIYLEKGYDLKIDYDAKNQAETIGFTGIGAEVNNYLLAKDKMEKEVTSDFNKLYGLDEVAFKSEIENLKEDLVTLLQQSTINPDFKEKETRNINYQYRALLNNYEQYHGYATEDKGFMVSKDFYDKIKPITFDNAEDFLFSKDYKSMVKSYYLGQARTISQRDSLPLDLAYMKALDSTSNQIIKNNLLFERILNKGTYNETLDDLYTGYLNTSASEAQKQKIKEHVSQLKKLIKGQPSPKFVNYENFSGGTTSLDDLKGKYVYIDVWATWCGPCKKEIPFLKEIEKKFEDSNIEFVSISIDKERDKAKWRQMISDEELGGMQLLAENDFNSQFLKEYKIVGIPHFILLDTNGNIIDANAPRPSSNEIVQLIDSYL